jgi:hypothetical protein
MREEGDMGRITLSESALGELEGVSEPVDVCDPSGKVRGRFIPQPEEEPELVTLARKVFDLKEVDRRITQEKQGYTTEEVKERLRCLEQGA